MIWPFSQTTKNNKESSPQEPLRPIRLVIVSSDENSTIPLKKVIANGLNQASLFSVSFEQEQVFENFLNFDHKNFFDFWDTGAKILKKNNADILIRLQQEKNNVRINFQTADMYQIYTPPFFSLLDSFYLPIAYFKQEALPSQISAFISGTLLAFNLKKDARYLSYLEKVLEILSKNKTPDGLEHRFLPHLLNLLALTYISAKSAHFEKNDVKLVLNLISVAYKNLSVEYESISEGTLLSTLGQMYQCALSGANTNAGILIQRAVAAYKKAQKHFNRYVFPYDYGRLSFVLSKLYFRFFQLTDDGQALRDAVFHLREAEKIFTPANFPHLWAQIQGHLGTYLSILSSRSNSEEIAHLAIQKYKNEQNIFKKEDNPQPWADLEIQIGDIYYHIGRHILNKSYLEESIKYYNSALDVFDNLKQIEKANLIQRYIQKADEAIMRLN